MKSKSSKSKGVWKKRMFISLTIVFGLIVAGISYWNLSPNPKAFLIKRRLKVACLFNPIIIKML